VVKHDRIARVYQALTALVEFTVECRPDFSTKEGYEPGDEKAPFFSETFLYLLLGKMDARTLLARLRRVCEAVDMDTSRF